MSPQAGNGYRCRLLLVERDVDKRQRLYELLRAAEFSVCTAACGEMALQVLAVERPDVILLDPELGDMPARQLIEQVRAFNPTVPILALGAASRDLNGLVQARVAEDLEPEHLVTVIGLWAAAVESPMSAVSRGTVLLIDDEPRMRTIMQHLLEINGFTVIPTSSGEEGLAQLGRLTPLAVLLDVRMPGMDGFVTLKKIRAIHPVLPVILVTQVDEEGAREEAARLGVTAYVTKPFNFEQLKELLGAVLSAASTKSPTSSASESSSTG